MVAMEPSKASANNPHPVQPKRRAGLVVPHQPEWHQKLAAWVVVAMVRALAATIRFTFEDRSGCFENGPEGPMIFCIWHNRLALSLSCYYAYARHGSPTLGMAALVSASKDGAFLAAILKGFGVQPVRGSTSRRGPQALLELTTWAERGYDLAITPDGPRGPRYIVQEGVMSLAQLTGRPILPVVYNLRRKVRLRSWDGFQVPLPFTRCHVVIEKPVTVPRGCPYEIREGLRKGVEETMLALTKD